MPQPEAKVIVLTAPQARVTAGGSVTFSAIAKDASGDKINGADITFESDNAGLVRAVANGTATITVRSGTAVAAYTVIIG